ncbi:MAG: hypothetical protein R6U96_16025 [Promethearchaeia archaeon]
MNRNYESDAGKPARVILLSGKHDSTAIYGGIVQIRPAFPYL